ncbi:TPA: hypothetical protein DCQ44_03140 [Candidatus Taylorbacteria bacterium]|nr:hypothetical protein [Candidatus Taylorbacteria bacterium]
MKIYKNKKAYIVATVFGLSLIIIIPSVSFAQKVHNQHIGLMKSGVQIGLFKPHMAEYRAHFGVVSSVNGSVFTLNSPGKKNQPDFTVNTDANTIFKKDGVSSSLSELVAGQHAVVRGLTATSTNTISAQSVNIITHEPTRNGLRHVFNK